MMRFTKSRWILAVAFAGLTPALAAAQQTNADNVGYGTTSAEFLLLGANARGTALGGSYISVATDVGGVNANPSAIALMTRAGAQFSQYNYVADTKLNWGAIAFPFGGGSKAFGMQIGTYGFTGQPVYTPSAPDGTGELYDVSETFAALTFAQNFSDRFSVGITAKGVFDQLGEASGTAFALDFGTHFHSNLNGKPIRFAFTLTNLGTSLKYEGDALRTSSPRDSIEGQDPIANLPQPSTVRTSGFSLPTTFRVGLAYDLLAQGNNRFTIMGEFNQQRSNKAAFGFAGEFAANKLGGSGFGVAVRGSYSSTPANAYTSDFFGVGVDKTSAEKSQGLAVGGGLNYSSANFSLGFDYAYRKVGLLGTTNFFTISLGW
ncbi:MAG: PorV/PorQ family protein [Gemmatimonadota bacterium]